MGFSSRVVFLLALGYGSMALAGDGLLNRQVGGLVSETVSSHGHTYLAQGSTLVTVAWDDLRIPAVADISAPVEGLIRHLAVDGDSLWVSAAWEFEQGRLFEYSLEVPTSPRLVREWRFDNGEHPGWGVLHRIDDLLYIGSHDGTISAHRLAEAGVLQPVFEMALPPAGSNEKARSFKALDIWQEEVLLAVVERESTFHDLYMLDITDPANPEERSRFAGKQARDYVRLGDEVALVGFTGYQVIDWSNLANPHEIHFALVGFGAPYMDGGRFEAGYLIGYRDTELVIYDVIDASTVVELASIQVDDFADWVANGPQSAPNANLLTFVTASAELLTLDLGNPRDPKLHHILDLPPGFNVRRVRETEDTLFAVTSGGLSGLSEDLQPQWRHPASSANHDRFSDVVIGDQWLALSRSNADSFFFRPGNFDGVEQVSTLAPYADRLAWDEGFLWSFGQQFFPDLHLYEITNSGQLRTINVDSRSLPRIRDAARKGDIVYLANGAKGIVVARLTPSRLELATPLFFPDCYATSVDVQADLLVAACREDGPVLYDLSVPDAPLLVSRVDLGEASGQGWDVVIDGDLLWYSHSRGVALLDVSDPGRPFLIEQSPGFALVDESPQDSGRLSRSNRGGVWVAAGHQGLMELSRPVGPEWTGVWFDPEQVGQGLTLEVLADNGAVVTWFEYDERGHQRWLQGFGHIKNNRIEIPEVYRMKGPRFAAPGAFLDVDVVGSARLIFQDCNTGVVEFETDGETRQSIIEPLARTMKTGCRLSDDAVETDQANQSGLWFDPQLPGQGISLLWLDNGRALMNWFTFDSGGNPFWIQGVGDPVGDKLVFADLYTTLATRLGFQYDPTLFQIIPWGEAVLVLECGQGSLEWEASHGSFHTGHMSLERLTIPLGLEC